MTDNHNFTNLVDMFEKSMATFADRKLFGVKKDGAYQWMTYREMGESTDRFRA